MPLVTIQASQLSAEQKKRIGDRIIDAFHREGIPGGSVVILYPHQDVDILLDGGYLVETGGDPAPEPAMAEEASGETAFSEAFDEFKTKSRRNRAELAELKAALVAKLQAKGALSSFQAQDELGLKDCDWAPSTLRRFFSELEEEGVIIKQGQKRGTRYVWKAISNPGPGGVPRLVKKPGAHEDGEE
ncbi:MAG TPA: hypothetical protein VN436_14090 [Holophaga sp.]|nr:hypothetical protein [Holophaga sp.]